MVGLNKAIATLALAMIVLAFTAPALAQGMPMAPTMRPTAMPMAPTMMPTAKPMAPTMMPTMMPGMQDGMQGGMPMQMTTSNKDMMSTMQDMSDLSMAMSVMKSMGMDTMMMKDKQKAMNMMKGYMMDGMMMPADMTDGKMLTMMNGQSMKVSMANGKMMIDGATVMKAVQTTNGMIYVIDNIPSSMMSMMQMGMGQTGAAPAKM